MNRQHTDIKQQPGYGGDAHQKALAEALRVIARNQHGGDLKPRGGSHHDPGQLLRQMQLINNK